MSEANEVADRDAALAHMLQPLLEQEALLESFVQEANAQRKYEDAKSLRENLKEIRAEIDRMLKAGAENGSKAMIRPAIS
jgi:rabenosyn-5